MLILTTQILCNQAVFKGLTDTIQVVYKLTMKANQVNIKKGDKMKTKKIQAGVYQITTNKDIYTVEQNDELFDKVWEIFTISFNSNWLRAAYSM